MNILILTFSFLAILALSTASFWHIATSVRQETAAFCGFLSANREAENALQRKLYKKLPSPASAEAPPSQTMRTGKTSSKYSSHRVQAHPHQYARLELSALWKEDSHLFVEKAFKRLLHELYGHTNWFAEAEAKGEVDYLVDMMARFGKEEKEPFALHELFASLPQQQAELFYKMLKGTHTYSLEKNKTGYPPLLEFVSFSFGSVKQTCRFSFASLPLLRALFDEETVRDILALEKKKWEKDHRRHTCTKDELLVLLQHRHASLAQPDSLDTYFHFGNKAAASDHILASDKLTGISSQKRI